MKKYTTMNYLIHQFNVLINWLQFKTNKPYKISVLTLGMGFVFSVINVNSIFAQACTSNTSGTYGLNSWNAHVYKHNGSGSPAVTNPFESGNYIESFSETEIFDRNWGSGSPDCAPTDNFSIRYKMKRDFPCGKYRFEIGGDDGMRLSIDGGQSWLVGNWADHSYTTETSVEVQLGGSTDLVLEFYERGGVARLSFKYSYTALPQLTGLDAGNDVVICSGDEVVLNEIGISNSTQILFSEDFQSYNTISPLTTSGSGWRYSTTTNSAWNWQIKNSCGSKTLNMYDSYGNDCDYAWNNDGNKIAWYGTSFNTSSGNAVMGFNWKAEGEESGGTIYDYGNVVYSSNGGSNWTDLPTKYYNKSSWQSVVGLALPSSNNLLIGFRWRNDNSTGTFPGFVLGDILIKDIVSPTYTWSGGPIVSGANTLMPIVNPTTTTTYTLTATKGGCTASDDVLVTILPPPGSPSDFGDNIWNVYGYNGNNLNMSSNTYRGFYEQPNLGGGNYGIDTEEFWRSDKSPVYAGVPENNGNLWKGCDMEDNQHTFVSKRKGFPCGNYKIEMNKWDDKALLIIDGVEYWDCNVWWNNGTSSNYAKIPGSTSSSNCELATSFEIKLDADSKIEVRSFENSGASLLKLDIIKIAPQNLSSTGVYDRTCRTKGNDWIDFIDNDNNLIASINPNEEDLGNVTIKSYVSSPQVMKDCNAPNNTLYHTAYMGRSWVMVSDVYTNGANFNNGVSVSVSVRLSFSNAELTDLNAKAQNTTTGNPFDGGSSNPVTSANLMLTKITGSTENGIANQADCASTIRAVTSAAYGSNHMSITNSQYVDFEVQQFSEFFLHKNNDGSPLPVKLTNFSPSCENNVSIHWTTTSEQNSDYFVVEKSRDGQNWIFVAEQNAAGNSSEVVNYSQLDDNISGDLVYYRLRQIDFDGKEEVYGPIRVSCDNIESGIKVYPNPNDGSFTVEILSNGSYSEVDLFLTDITGKVIVAKQVNISEGTTQIMVDDLDLRKGSYFVSLHGTEISLKPIKVIVK